MTRRLNLRTILRLFPLVISGFIGTSCQKVIDVDLNSAAPQIVIEANVSDQPGPDTVLISQTVNFDQTNTFPPVSGARILISDNAGNTDTLSEPAPGTYITSHLQGTPGRTYTIDVSVNGKSYVASSTMPPPVNIDSLTLENLTFGRNSRQVIDVHFKDPAGSANYYRFVEERNGIRLNFIFLIDNRVQEGDNITSILFADDDTLFSGDIMTVLLERIDKNVYNYFTTAREISNQGGAQLASPTNPPSNFSNGALGCFSAYAVRSKSIIIP
jgi:hypothetical protein